MDKKKTVTKTEVNLNISPPRFHVAEFKIRGIAPYVQNRFSAKAMQMMREKQESGSQGAKGKKREAKDFHACYEGAMHVSEEGWHGIPAPAFRNAAISACRVCGFKMTHAKLTIFIEADGFDQIDSTPLVRITKGKPEYVEHHTRNETGVCDIRPRPMWKSGWEAIVRVRYDEDQFSLEDVTNLMMRIGLQVGVGEGRPDSKKSCGMGWGMFELCGK
uniref:CRISPR-associated protein n=1 Tax=viral metagenome TaxID=1070528 RepID=A0A6M3XT74_9ZZZZ